MSHTIVTLYSNDPMGKRWLANFAAASRAEAELGAEIVIVKKTAPDYRPGIDPPCPSVLVDGRVVVSDGTVAYEALAAEILRGGR